MADVGFTAQIQSDFRYRGVSLSDGRPDIQGTVNFDADTGAYGGGSVLMAQRPGQSELTTLGDIEYLGYAVKLDQGPSLDFGAATAHFVNRAQPGYSNVYAGLMLGGASVRLSYAPDDYNQYGKTLYAEVNDSLQVAPQWRIFGHVGALTRLSSWLPSPAHRESYDLGFGAGFDLKICRIQASWVTSDALIWNPQGSPPHRSALVFELIKFF